MRTHNPPTSRDTRFNRESKTLLRIESQCVDPTLGEFISAATYSDWLVDRYSVPYGCGDLPTRSDLELPRASSSISSTITGVLSSSWPARRFPLTGAAAKSIA
jgi:hypothetical protein